MYHKLKKPVALVLAITLLSTCLGCSSASEEGNKLIVGLVTDMTGPASSFLKIGEAALLDSVAYMNEEGTIPGVEMEVATYDCRYDPSRDIPGYEWLKQAGASVIYTGIPTFGDTLKATAGRDEYPIVSSAPTLYQLTPPGWVFGLTPPTGWIASSFLEWIAEEDWDYESEGRKPLIGCVGWDEPYQKDVTEAMEEYVAAHPDEFELVAGLLVPMSTMTWSGEIEALKDCDYIYIPSTGLGTATFAKAYRDRGYTATFIGLDAMTAFLELLVDKAGWDYLDGSLTAHTTLYWNDDFPIVEKAKGLLAKYHAGHEQEIISSGVGYVSIFFCAQFLLDLLAETVEQVGIENFDGQAFYDTAVGFNWTKDGLPDRGYGFTESIRYARKDITVYEWKAGEEDLVRVSDWRPADE